jgi:hypothetical protein
MRKRFVYQPTSRALSELTFLSLPHFRQILYHTIRPLTHICLDGRRTKNDFVVGNIVNNAGLGCNGDVVSDINMAHDTNLSSDCAAVPDVG